MVACDSRDGKLLTDPFDYVLKEHPRLRFHVSTFCVHNYLSTPQPPRPYQQLLFVFKKKKFTPSTARGRNIYHTDTNNVEVDREDPSKSRMACLRCRRAKKKCTRHLPECLNCMSCDQICVYYPRKRCTSEQTKTMTDSPSTPEKEPSGSRHSDIHKLLN